MSAHKGLVLHVQVGDNSCYGEFAVPANQASSTWWVAKSGVLEQYVDADLAAWAEAQGNATWDSVETEGLPSEPLTSAQITTLARLFAWGHQVYGWPFVVTDDVNGAGLGWHGMGASAWGGHLGCPGDIRKAQRGTILALARPVIATATAANNQEGTDVFILPHPDGKRLDLFSIPASGVPDHWWTDDRADMTKLAHESMGGSAKTIAACWQNGLLYVTVHGSDDNAWCKCSNGSFWIWGWTRLAVGALAPIKP